MQFQTIYSNIFAVSFLVSPIHFPLSLEIIFHVKFDVVNWKVIRDSFQFTG